MSIKQVTRWITITALFLAPFFAVVVASPDFFPYSINFFFPFITGKAFFFRILVEIAFAGWLILAFWDAKYRPRLNALTIAVTVFAGVALVADLLGANPIRSITSNFERMEGWLVVFHLWMFFMAITYTFGQGEEGKRLWFRWLNVSLFVAFCVAGRGVLQWAGKIAIEQSSTRPDSFLGNAAYMAVYMLINSGIAVYMFLSTQIERKALLAHHHRTIFIVREWVYAILAIFFGTILFSTATRGAIIGYVGGIMLALLLYAIFGGHKDSAHDSSKHVLSTENWRLISGGVIIIVLLIGFITWSNGSNEVAKTNPISSVVRFEPLVKFVAKSESLSRLTSISLSEFQNEGRAYIWPMAIKGFKQRPILGWGQENFNYIFNANYNPHMWSQEQWFDRAHSVYLDWLVSSGLVGLLAYLSLYVLFLVLVWKSSVPVSVKSVLTGLVVGYAVNNVFVFDNLASYAPFFALLGLALMLRSLENKGGTKNPDHEKSEPKVLCGSVSVSNDAIEYVVAPIVIVLLIAGLYFWNTRPIQANLSLIAAMEQCQQGGTPDPDLFKKALAIDTYVANQETREQILACASTVISSQQVPGPLKQSFFATADQAITDQIAATPKDARIYTLGGSFLTAVNQFAKAIPILETAHMLSPGKQSINFDLAAGYLNTGKPDKAIELLKATYDSDQTYPQAQLAYASALVFGGKEAQARDMFKGNPAIFQSDTMARVFTSLKQYDKAISIYKNMVANDSTNLQAKAMLAQTQYTAGLKSDAIQTLKDIEKDHPEYTDSVEQAIKQMK